MFIAEDEALAAHKKQEALRIQREYDALIERQRKVDKRELEREQKLFNQKCIRELETE